MPAPDRPPTSQCGVRSLKRSTSGVSPSCPTTVPSPSAASPAPELLARLGQQIGQPHLRGRGRMRGQLPAHGVDQVRRRILVLQVDRRVQPQGLRHRAVGRAGRVADHRVRVADRDRRRARQRRLRRLGGQRRRRPARDDQVQPGVGPLLRERRDPPQLLTLGELRQTGDDHEHHPVPPAAPRRRPAPRPQPLVGLGEHVEQPLPIGHRRRHQPRVGQVGERLENRAATHPVHGPHQQRPGRRGREQPQQQPAADSPNTREHRWHWRQR